MNFLDQEIAIIRHHHEKWSGNGYPDGLAGEQIPMGARIIGVADTFDAITSTRAYHESRSVKEAVDIMTKLSGKDFDPDIVDAMVSWVRTIAGKAGSIDQVGPEHLLQSSDCDGTIQALVNAGAHL
jgi:HD-GYP domain-containing protein (c-di-GMP phosphodiesterase class II)